MIEIRDLTENELPLIWGIDRAEVIKNIYYLREGELILEPEYYGMKGWPEGESEHYGPFLEDCFKRGGFFWGAFEEETLVGLSVLESKFIGSKKETLKLKFCMSVIISAKRGWGKSYL